MNLIDHKARQKRHRLSSGFAKLPAVSITERLLRKKGKLCIQNKAEVQALHKQTSKSRAKT